MVQVRFNNRNGAKQMKPTYFAHFVDGFGNQQCAKLDSVFDAIELVNFMGNGYVTSLIYEVKPQ